MEESSISRIYSFCVFALTLGKLTSADSQRMKVCRDVCSKTNGCLLFQEGIVTFACHGPVHDGEDSRKRPSQSMVTDKGMKCTQPCTSELEYSTVTGRVNMGKMMHDALETTSRNHSNRDHQTEEIRGSGSQTRTDAETQDAREMKTKEVVLNETVPNASLLNKSLPTSSKRDHVLEQSPKNKGKEGGRIFYTKSRSPSHRKGQNQDPKTKGTGTITVNESTTSDRAINSPNSKIRDIGKGNIYQTKSGFGTSNGVLSQDSKSTGAGTSLISESTPSSPTDNTVQGPKSVGTGMRRMDASSTKTSLGISLQSQDSTGNETSHSGISTDVLQKPPSKLDRNTREQASNSQSTVNMEQKRVAGEKTGDGDISQSERNAHAIPQGYEKMTAGKTTYNVRRYAVKKTWEEALEQCRSDGGTLVKISNRFKNRSLTKKYAFFKSHWIGLKDLHDNNSYFWTDGEPLTFSKWQTGQPSHTDPDGKKENCVDLSVDLFKGQGWSDQSCDKLYEFICEI